MAGWRRSRLVQLGPLDEPADRLLNQLTRIKAIGMTTLMVRMGCGNSNTYSHSFFTTVVAVIPDLEEELEDDITAQGRLSRLDTPNLAYLDLSQWRRHRKQTNVRFSHCPSLTVSQR